MGDIHGRDEAGIYVPVQYTSPPKPVPTPKPSWKLGECHEGMSGVYSGERYLKVTGSSLQRFGTQPIHEIAARLLAAQLTALESIEFGERAP